MSTKTLTDNGTWETGVAAECAAGYRTLAYSGSLGGGTLQVLTTIDGVLAPVPDAKLTAATLDGNGEAVKQLPFIAGGVISVVLSGATGPNVALGLA